MLGGMDVLQFLEDQEELRAYWDTDPEVAMIYSSWSRMALQAPGMQAFAANKSLITVRRLCCFPLPLEPRQHAHSPQEPTPPPPLFTHPLA